MDGTKWVYFYAGTLVRESMEEVDYVDGRAKLRRLEKEIGTWDYRYLGRASKSCNHVLT